MRTITGATETLRFWFPTTWKLDDLNSISIQISNDEGTELLASEQVFLESPETLAYDSTRYSTSIVMSAGSEDLKTGDIIRIVGILGYEDHTVEGWDSDNLTATLENFVDRDFEAGASVYRLFVDATVDFSDEDDFPIGTTLVVTWTPAGTGGAVTELFEVEGFLQFDPSGFTRLFKVAYKRAYKALTSPEDNFSITIEIAQDELRTDLEDRLLDITRIKDQRLIIPPLMALVAVVWARDGDKNTADELAVYERAYSAAFEKLCRKPIWVDLDGDGINDDGELQDHPQIFERNW